MIGFTSQKNLIHSLLFIAHLCNFLNLYAIKIRKNLKWLCNLRGTYTLISLFASRKIL